jgi:uncharacterized Ntn-hydrolase superfamily protein
MTGADEDRDMQLTEMGRALKAAYDAMNHAWGSVAHAQDVMTKHGVPSQITDMLADVRLRVSDTSQIADVVRIIHWHESAFQEQEPNA